MPEAEQSRQRAAYEKKMRRKMAAKPAVSEAHAVVAAEEMLRDAAAVNEGGDLAVGMRERATAVDSPSESARQQDRIVSTVEELASLCKQLMEEQKDLREQIALSRSKQILLSGKVDVAAITAKARAGSEKKGAGATIPGAHAGQSRRKRRRYRREQEVGGQVPSRALLRQAVA